MSPEQLQAEKARLEKKVLGDRAKANRQATSAEMGAKSDEVNIYLEEMPGSNSPRELTEDAFNAKYGEDESKHPQTAKPGDEKRVNRQLKEDEYAREALAWIEENGKAVEVPRKEKVTAIVKQAARKGDVRPPSTPLPESPAVPDVDLTQRPDVATLEILDNEARLMDEFQAIDDALAGDKLEAERLAIGYDEMTFEQKKGAGMLDGLAEAKPAAKAEFVMPQAYAKSKPTFGQAQLKFESDLDRAAYMLQSKTTGAKADKKREVLFAALKERGISRREALDLGAEVKAKIQDGIQEATGSRRAPQEAITIEVPASKEAVPSLSRTGPQLSRSGGYDEGKFRKLAERAAERKKFQQEAALLSIGLKLPSDIARLAQVSDTLGREMVAGLKDAARISGLDPLRIQYLDKVDTRKLFGDVDANQALEQWDPNAARFARENPGDPLMDIVDGETNGVFVPRNYPSLHRSMIYLAMGPSLDTRLMDKGLSVAGGTPLPRTAYHEAFHAVQDWLEMMSVKPGVRAGSSPMLEALSTDEAVAEMTELVKGNRFGNYQEGMSLKELQAEAFATWYNNRKVRMKAGGVQAAFEKIKKFVNTLRRKWKLAAGKDPSYVDVFELAAAGKIADKGNEAIAKLRPEQLEALKGRIDSNMDAMLPELTDRVQSYLRQKQADFDVLTDKLADEIDMEGC
jgi:hypothetical protein